MLTKAIPSYPGVVVFVSDADFSCQPPKHKCTREGTRICLDPEYLCNGNNDCDDKSDEGGECESELFC